MFIVCDVGSVILNNKHHCARFLFKHFDSSLSIKSKYLIQTTSYTSQHINECLRQYRHWTSYVRFAQLQYLCCKYCFVEMTLSLCAHITISYTLQVINFTFTTKYLLHKKHITKKWRKHYLYILWNVIENKTICKQHCVFHNNIKIRKFQKW